jgi:hypothetical protein
MVIGTWKCNSSAADADPGDEGNAFTARITDGKFVLTFEEGDTPLTGTWKIDGGKLSITVDKIQDAEAIDPVTVTGLPGSLSDGSKSLTGSAGHVTNPFVSRVSNGGKHVVLSFDDGSVTCDKQ